MTHPQCHFLFEPLSCFQIVRKCCVPSPAMTDLMRLTFQARVPDKSLVQATHCDSTHCDSKYFKLKSTFRPKQGFLRRYKQPFFSTTNEQKLPLLLLFSLCCLCHSSTHYYTYIDTRMEKTTFHTIVHELKYHFLLIMRTWFCVVLCHQSEGETHQQTLPAVCKSRPGDTLLCREGETEWSCLLLLLCSLALHCCNGGTHRPLVSSLLFNM